MPAPYYVPKGDRIAAVLDEIDMKDIDAQIQEAIDDLHQEES